MVAPLSWSTSAVLLHCSASTARICSGCLIGLSENLLVGLNSNFRQFSSTVRFSRRLRSSSALKIWSAATSSTVPSRPPYPPAPHSPLLSPPPPQPTHRLP